MADTDHRQPWYTDLARLAHCGASPSMGSDGVPGSSVAYGYGFGVLVGATRPLIFVDVDGVLIPFRARSTGARRLGSGVGDAVDGFGNPLLDRLDPADGVRLLALPGELVWASTWMAEANEVVAPRLGLPVLAVVDWPDDDEELGRGVHWKTVHLARWAAGRAFVWLDDEITDTDRRWVAAHHSRPALLHRVDPCLGLVDADLAAVRSWLEKQEATG